MDPSPMKKPLKVRVRRFFEQSGKHLLIILVSMFFLVPFIWMLSTSLKSKTDIGRVPPNFIPRDNKSMTIDGTSYTIWTVTMEDGSKKELALLGFNVEGGTGAFFDPISPPNLITLDKNEVSKVYKAVQIGSVEYQIWTQKFSDGSSRELALLNMDIATGNGVLFEPEDPPELIVVPKVDVIDSGTIVEVGGGTFELYTQTMSDGSSRSLALILFDSNEVNGTFFDADNPPQLFVVAKRDIERTPKTITYKAGVFDIYKQSTSDGGGRELALIGFDTDQVKGTFFDPLSAPDIISVPKKNIHEILVVRFAWENYPNAILTAARPGMNVTYLTYIKNSMIISFFTILGTLLSCAPVAYAFARVKFPGRDILFVLVLSTMMLPFQVTMVPLYRFFNEVLHWGDTFLPLIVPAFFTNAYDIFLLRQFFRTIPEEMCDAARVDGASELQIFFRIILPLSIPVLSTIAVFTFLYAWNDFTGPLIYLQSHKNFTMALGLQDFQSQHAMQWNLMMAASVVFTIPIIIAFFFLQKQFIQGIKLTGSKES
jgi:multiple sugar transport system permease protein